MNRHSRTFIVLVGVVAICMIALLHFNSRSIADVGPFTKSGTSQGPITLNESVDSLPKSVPTLSLPQTNPTQLNLLSVLKAEPQTPVHRGWVAIQGASAPFKISTQAREQMTVDVSSADLGNVKSGDQVNFQLPDGSEAVAHVENTWTENNGDQVWSGHVEDVAGRDYRIVVTQGVSATFATINTSKGSYSLESINGRGVVYKNPEMGDVAPKGSTDYLMPES